jgi:hypothetical protein
MTGFFVWGGELNVEHGITDSNFTLRFSLGRKITFKKVVGVGGGGMVPIHNKVLAK